MPLFSALIHYVKLRGAHNRQKRTALLMLALSGVIRPSHVELRYPTHRRRHSNQPSTTDQDRAVAA
jgi:hypothetical protein